MGWLYNNVCYTSQNDAIDEFFNAIPPSVTQNSTNTFVTKYIKTGQSFGVSTYQLNIQQHTTAGAISTNRSFSVVNPVLPTCTNESDPTTKFLDGMELGWAVASCCAIAWAIRFLRTRH